MSRIRLMVAAGVIAAVLLVGAAVAYAGWWWNAQIDVQGTTLRTIWSVTGDEDGSTNYFANINVALPQGVAATVLSQAATESVSFSSDSGLACGSGSIESIVSFNVAALDGAVGKRVKVTVTANDMPIGHGNGSLGEDIGVTVSIPTSSPGC